MILFFLATISDRLLILRERFLGRAALPIDINQYDTVKNCWITLFYTPRELKNKIAKESWV